jgi:hypothetical protein
MPHTSKNKQNQESENNENQVKITKDLQNQQQSSTPLMDQQTNKGETSKGKEINEKNEGK